MEPYLKQIKKAKLRRSLTALRISAHRLEIETGRYAGKNKDFVKREERLCSLCAVNGIEVMGDEIHAVLVCPKFDKDRQKTISMLSQRYPNFMGLSDHNKLMFMMTCEDESIQLVCKLVHTVLTAGRHLIKRPVRKRSRKVKVRC